MKKIFDQLLQKLNHRKASRGIGLVEAVMAMAVIGIVTATAIAIILSANNTYINTQQQLEAQYTVDAALECFLYADDYDDESPFYGALSTYNTMCLRDEIFSYSYDSTLSQHIYRYDRRGYDVEIRITEASSGGRDYFKATVTKADTGETVWDLEYYKGDLAP